MKTNPMLPMAAVLAGLVSLSGCSLIVKAAKGEITPIGVQQAGSGDVSSLAQTVATTDDPAKFTRAFSDLASVYLYKCLDDPTMAAREGKAEIREQAGASLLSAMQKRVANHELGADPTVAASAADIAALEGKVQAKCDAAKLAKLDTGGQLSQAVALAQPAGRDAYVEKTARALDADLEAALADERSVLKWADGTCAQLLPRWGYCVPRATEAYYSKGQWDSIVTVFLSSSAKQTAEVLPTLARTVGQDQVVQDVRGYLFDKGSAPPSVPNGLEQMVVFLRANGAWGSCEEREGMLERSLHGDNSSLAQWAIGKIVEDQCHNLDDDIVESLGSDSPYVREAAAWATGELKIQKAKKHVERLRYSDPYLDEGCWCRPVRDAASNAYNKLELENG